MESSQDAGPARWAKNQSGGLESGKARTILFHRRTVGTYKENQVTGPQNQYPNVIEEQGRPIPNGNTTKINALQNPLAKITLLGQPLM